MFSRNFLILKSTPFNLDNLILNQILLNARQKIKYHLFPIQGYLLKLLIVFNRRNDLKLASRLVGQVDA